MKRARSILWPEPQASLVDEAMSADDVEFVEEAVLQAFELADPVYVVGCQYYTTRKNVRYLQRAAAFSSMVDRQRGQRACALVS